MNNLPSHPIRIVWETRYELEARLRRCDLASQRDAVRMLLHLRAHGELTDFEVGELIGRAAHEVWQWWMIYHERGLTSLLHSAETVTWHAITGIAAPHHALPALPFEAHVPGAPDHQ